MDILQELSVDQWPVLQGKLKSLWPLNLPGFYFLYMNFKCPIVRQGFQFKVYCPYGDISHGFVGTNIKRTGTLEVILFSLTEDTSVLEEAIIKTKLIDWSWTVCFDPITSLTLKALERVKDAVGFTKFIVKRPTMFVLDRNTEPYKDLRLPENTYVAPVKEKHIPRVADTWPHKHSAAISFFSTFVACGTSYGLYSTSHELLAWVFFNEGHYVCHLYCEEPHRRKGYAEFMLKWISNEQLEEGNDIYAYIVEGNEKSTALFKKVGFKAVDESAFVTIEK